jgi:hypothetical protein
MQYLQEIKQILAAARQKTYQAINSAMIEAFWKIGERIVIEEQGGKERAAYGKHIVQTVSIELTKEFGRGFLIKMSSFFFTSEFKRVIFRTLPKILAILSKSFGKTPFSNFSKSKMGIFVKSAN